MAWDDPSPRARARPSARGPAAQPGYAASEVRLSFATMLWRATVALFIGGMIYAGVHALLVAWLGAPHALLAMAIALAGACVLGWLILRMLLRRPAFVGLPRAVRDGGGWFRGRRGWDDSYAGMTFGEAVAADVVGDVVGAVIDAATD